jgi:hypothetical protein
MTTHKFIALAAAVALNCYCTPSLTPASRGSDAGADGRAAKSAFPGPVERATIRLGTDLASEAPPGQTAKRDQAIDRLATEMARSTLEQEIGRTLFHETADSQFTSLVASRSNEPADYLEAARRSYARHRAAEAAGQQSWQAKHLTATRKYAALAVDGLRTEIKRNEETLGNLKGEQFAVRRPLEDARRLLEGIRREGFGPDYTKVMRDSGMDEKEMEAYKARVLTTPPERLGVSIAEMYGLILRGRRTLAASLDRFAQTGATASEPLSQTYLVGNPHDNEETIDLYIRGAAVPSEWKLSIVDAEPPKDGKGAPRVEEVKPGVHYRVNLPAKGTIRVASVVRAPGDVGANTTARWAVEGRIGAKSLGGIVHEWHVPPIPDLELPPVASADQRAETTAPLPAPVGEDVSRNTPVPAPVPDAPGTRPGWLIPAGIAAGVLLAVAVIWLLRRRTVHRSGP